MIILNSSQTVLHVTQNNTMFTDTLTPRGINTVNILLVCYGYLGHYHVNITSCAVLKTGSVICSLAIALQRKSA